MSHDLQRSIGTRPFHLIDIIELTEDGVGCQGRTSWNADRSGMRVVDSAPSVAVAGRRRWQPRPIAAAGNRRQSPSPGTAGARRHREPRTVAVAGNRGRPRGAADGRRAAPYRSRPYQVVAATVVTPAVLGMAHGSAGEIRSALDLADVWGWQVESTRASTLAAARGCTLAAGKISEISTTEVVLLDRRGPTDRQASSRIGNPAHFANAFLPDRCLEYTARVDMTLHAIASQRPGSSRDHFLTGDIAVTPTRMPDRVHRWSGSAAPCVSPPSGTVHAP
jgi:hypothetical protein